MTDARLPWPAEIAGLGRLRIMPFDACADCGAGTWSYYGTRTPLCLRCARTRATAAPAALDGKELGW